MRRGVTLIELLITMTIAAIIAAAILGTASSAIESSRRSRTISIVTKIDALVSDWWATYSTRRVELNQDIQRALDGITDTSIRGKAMADMRLLAVRELMKMEMPDRWSDVSTAPVIIDHRSGLSAAYNARLLGAKPSYDNQGAECLYMFVMRATGDGEAASMFNADQIADTDGDGFNEFIDGWGKPISWLRWPTGYVSPLMTGDYDKDHDPLDPYNRDVAKQNRVSNHFPRPSSPAYPAAVLRELSTMEARDGGAFRIVPLIYSIGPDEQQSFTSKEDDFAADLDPYSTVEPDQLPEDDGLAPGTVHEDRNKDDITNHAASY